MWKNRNFGHKIRIYIKYNILLSWTRGPDHRYNQTIQKHKNGMVSHSTLSLQWTGKQHQKRLGTLFNKKIKLQCKTHQRWADCHTLRSRTDFLKLILFAIRYRFFKTQSRSNYIPKLFSQMKSKKFEKCSLFTTKVPHLFSNNSVQIRSRSYILKWLADRIQSNFNKICYCPDPVQCSSLKHTSKTRK